MESISLADLEETPWSSLLSLSFGARVVSQDMDRLKNLLSRIHDHNSLWPQTTLELVPGSTQKVVIRVWDREGRVGHLLLVKAAGSVEVADQRHYRVGWGSDGWVFPGFWKSTRVMLVPLP